MKPGRVHGYHRAFCIRSTLYRGTPEKPGIVLGLNRGGSCTGMAFRLCNESRAQALRALYEREMNGDLYLARHVSVSTQHGQRIKALAFIANPRSSHYEPLSDDDIMGRLLHCRGQRGPNYEYALMTWRSLQNHALDCPHLERLGRRLLASPIQELSAVTPHHAQPLSTPEPHA